VDFLNLELRVKFEKAQKLRSKQLEPTMLAGFAKKTEHVQFTALFMWMPEDTSKVEVSIPRGNYFAKTKCGIRLRHILHDSGDVISG
jgi:hypothetical protein